MKYKALALSVLCALLMTSCEDSDSSSKSKKDKSQADASSVSDTASESDSYDDTSSGADTSSVADSKDNSSEPDEDSSSLPDSPEKVYDPGLVKLAKEMYSAKEVTGSGEELEDKFKADFNKPGDLILCADIKTADLFDPFDDLIVNVSLAASGCPNAQVFIFTELFDYGSSDGKTDVDTDGYIFSVAFGCKDSDDAKELYKTLTDDMKSDLAEDDDLVVYETDQSGDTERLIGARKEEDVFAGYYRVGSNIYTIAYYGMEFEEDDYPEGVTPKYDYRKELEKICQKLGVKSPTELR